MSHISLTHSRGYFSYNGRLDKLWPKRVSFVSVVVQEPDICPSDCLLNFIKNDWILWSVYATSCSVDKIVALVPLYLIHMKNRTFQASISSRVEILDWAQIQHLSPLRGVNTCIAGNAKAAAVDKVRYVVITKGLMFPSTYLWLISPFSFICEWMSFLSNERKSLKLSGLSCPTVYGYIFVTQYFLGLLCF